jgi:hypothetical protein
MTKITGTFEVRANPGWRFWALQKTVYILALMPESWHEAAIDWATKGVKIDVIFVDG